MSAHDATLALIELLGRAPEDFGLHGQCSYPARIAQSSIASSTVSTSVKVTSPWSETTVNLIRSNRLREAHPNDPIAMTELSRGHHAVDQSTRDSGYGVAGESWDSDVSACFLEGLFTITSRTPFDIL